MSTGTGPEKNDCFDWRHSWADPYRSSADLCRSVQNVEQRHIPVEDQQGPTQSGGISSTV